MRDGRGTKGSPGQQRQEEVHVRGPGTAKTGRGSWEGPGVRSMAYEDEEVGLGVAGHGYRDR